LKHGELAQLVEHLHGMQGVIGSNPLFSTHKGFEKNSKPFLFGKSFNIFFIALRILKNIQTTTKENEKTHSQYLNIAQSLLRLLRFGLPFFN
jgi:hypothetical protein